MIVRTAMSFSSGKRSVDVIGNEEEQCPKKDSSMEQNAVGVTAAANAATTSIICLPKLHTINNKCFTKVHFQLLKALYDPSSSDNSNVGEDDIVEERHWNCMGFFLEERQNIKNMASSVNDSGIVHEEVKSFQKLIAENPLAPSKTRFNRYVVTVRKNTLSSHKKTSIKKCSLNRSSHLTSARFFSGASRFGSSPGSARGRFMGLSAQSCQGMEQELGGNPFGMIAGMLKQRHQLTSNHFQRVAVAPLKELIQNAQVRIKLLESGLKEENAKQRQNELSAFLMARSQKDRMVLEKSEEVRVRTETKLELWNMLLQDVTSAIE
jgi:hypothetical protein